MILEGLVTTRNEDRTVHISTMGPDVEADFHHLLLRPFQQSRTFVNLQRERQGVFHVTDDVELMARAAVGRFDQMPAWTSVPLIDGVSLDHACRWYAFRVLSIDDKDQRANIMCQVVASKRQRDYFGLNRAKHAVVEAAILATRLSLIPADQVRAEMANLVALVQKTGGVSERRAFEFLQEYISDWFEQQK